MLAVPNLYRPYLVGPAKPSDTFSGKDYGHFSTQ